MKKALSLICLLVVGLFGVAWAQLGGNPISKAHQWFWNSSGQVESLGDVKIPGNVVIGTPLPVSSGGTGKASVTANGPIVGGTTTTGAFQSVAPGNAGQVLTSAGSGAPPTYQDPPAGTVPNGGAVGDILSWTGSAWSSGIGPSTWGMADEFWQDRPAGTVHNTLSTAKYPFLSRLRTVTDTESKLFISNGKLSFAGGKATPAWGDPGVWYGSLSRAAGRILTGKVSPSSTGQDFAMGWHHSQSGTFANSSSKIYFTTSGRIYPLESITVGTYSVGDYQYAVVLRANGSLVFVKGGAVYPNWTLVWVTAQGNTSPLYPALLNYNGTFSAHYLRIPSQLWLPSPLISDGYSGTDGALLSSRTTDGLGHAEGVAGGIGAGGAGSSWIGATGSLKAIESVSNGGFGVDTSSWTAANSALASVAGGQAGNCLQITNSSASTGVAKQAISVPAGLPVTLTVYAKNGTSGTGLRIYVGSSDGNAEYHSSGDVSPVDWTAYPITFTPTAPTVYLSLQNRGGSGTTVLFDSVTLPTTKAIVTPTLGAEVIVNGDMELDSDWLSFGTPAINERSSEQTRGGTFSRKFTADGAAEGISSNTFPVVAGVWFRANASVYGNGTNKSLVKVAIPGGTDRFSPLSVNAVGYTFPASWTDEKWTFRTDASPAAAVVYALSGTGQTAGTWYIDDVQLKTLSLSTLFSSVSASTANVVVSVDLARVVGTQVGLVLNLDDAANPANFIIAYLDGAGNAKLEKCIAGVYTSLISAAVTYVADAKLVVIKDGSSYDLYYNNAKVGTTATVSDAGIVSNVLHGLFSTYEGNTFDNFVVRARGTEGQYSVLDEIGAN